ncbi:tetraspanin-8 [Salmo trutta]|uniref:tetraspanin-8 n=1 Tax=Salmo trutta TaxID=8032 RepID=UPI0011315968|nr:tetraspanin-8-like [Salmo trutta]
MSQKDKNNHQGQQPPEPLPVHPATIQKISGYIILGVSIYLKVSRNGNVIMDEEVPFDLLIAAGVIIMVLGFLGCWGAIKENRCMLILISGCIILGVSIYLKVSMNVIMDEEVPLDLLIAAGVIIMVLGFLGCWGAIKENRCMLILFFIGLLLIFILLLIAGILGAVGEKKVLEDGRLGELLPLEDENYVVKVCKNAGGRKGYSTPCVKISKKIVPGTAFSFAVLMLFGMSLTMTLYCQIGKRDANTT